MSGDPYDGAVTPGMREIACPIARRADVEPKPNYLVVTVEGTLSAGVLVHPQRGDVSALNLLDGETAEIHPRGSYTKYDLRIAELEAENKTLGETVVDVTTRLQTAEDKLEGIGVEQYLAAVARIAELEAERDELQRQVENAKEQGEI